MANQGGVSASGGYGRTNHPDDSTPKTENGNGVMESVDDTNGGGPVLSLAAYYRLIANKPIGNAVWLGVSASAAGSRVWQSNGNGIQYSYAGEITDSSILTKKDGSVEDCPDYACIDTARFDRWDLDLSVRAFLGFGADDRGWNRVTVEPGIAFSFAGVDAATDETADVSPIAIDGVALPGALRQSGFAPGVTGTLDLGVLLTSNEYNALYLDFKGIYNGDRDATYVTRDGATSATFGQTDWKITAGPEWRFGQGALPKEEPPPPPEPVVQEPPPPPPVDEDCDDDGLTDAQEGELGTEKCNKDSDGDGLDDWLETDGGSPTNTDGDGKIDALDTDSDNDGLPDREEGGNPNTNRANAYHDIQDVKNTDPGCGAVDFRNPDDDCDTISTKVEVQDAKDLVDEGKTQINGTNAPSDADGDGINNWYDTDSDGDGKKDIDELRGDEDADGILNYMDADDATVAKVRLVIIKHDRFEITEKFHFDHNKATINSASFGLLDQLAEAMNSEEGSPAKKIEIQGHTDPSGSAEYNLDLSQRRADEVRKQLIARGVDGDRLLAQGYGETRLIDPASGTDYTGMTDTLRKANMKLLGKTPTEIKAANEVFRRVEFIITERDGE